MKTIIFDLDGTLVDTHLDITASINHVRKTLYGLEPMTAEEIRSVMNVPGLNLAYAFYGVEEYEPEAEALFEEHYSQQCLQRARTFDGVVETIEKLLAHQCELFVATNAPTTTSRLILQNNGIVECFKDIVGADRVKEPKPHPEMLHLIRQQSRYDEVWMVGDSPKDIMAAQRAEVNPLFVTWGYSQELPKEFASVPVVSKPLALIDIIIAS